jgi:PX domain
VGIIVIMSAADHGETTTTPSSSNCAVLATTTTTMMYLPPDVWSPRYDGSFFTVRCSGYEKRQRGPNEDDAAAAPDSSDDPASGIAASSGGDGGGDCFQYHWCGGGGGRDTYPAYYYKITVYREHTQTIVWRRYSQFYWLFRQLQRTTSNNAAAPAAVTAARSGDGGKVARLRMPPGTCPWQLQHQSDAFAANRQGQLAEFLSGLLLDLHPPDAMSHPALLEFLELQ